ncbi:MAG: histidine phosphatase family protein [Candidatus Pacebacteria bacterium]|nr:histidine phosphatase family protein [Candidatus Paceibacterota bacterium]MBP9840653.1 histidine phosphatase family protein [Candidatus Paceibacterota bacterium]
MKAIRKNSGTLKTLYVVRHGSSEGNEGVEFQHPDSPLSVTGRAQAEQIALRATKLDFEAIIASPLARAWDTALAISRACDKPFERLDLLVERVKPTELLGKRLDDPEAMELCDQWEESLSTPGMRVQDGENFDDLISRADAVLAHMLARPEKSILAVSHGYFTRMLIARVLMPTTLTGEQYGELHWNIVMQNTGISVFQYVENFRGKQHWRLTTHNDQAHLG